MSKNVSDRLPGDSKGVLADIVHSAAGKVVDVVASDQARPYRSAEPIAHQFKASKEAQAILEIFVKHFNPEEQAMLGIQITFRNGAWYLPWDLGKFETNLAPSAQLTDLKAVAASLDSPVQRSYRRLKGYQEEKEQRRAEDSFWSEPYKTLLALLCHKSMEGVCQYRFISCEQEMLMYDKFIQFLDAVWNHVTPPLVDPTRLHRLKGMHIEGYLRATQRDCTEQKQSLQTRKSSAPVLDWLKALDQQLEAVQIPYYEIYHYAIQGNDVPADLVDQLRQLGDVFQRLNSTDEKAIAITPKRYLFWEKIQQQAAKKIAVAISDGLITLPVDINDAYEKGILNFEEKLFFKLEKNYNAEQWLYELLYAAEALPANMGQQGIQVVNERVLALYRTPANPAVGWSCLQAHLQQSSTYLLPLLRSLEHQPPEGPLLSERMHEFIVEVKNLGQSEAKTLQPFMSMGIFAELLQKSKTEPSLIHSYMGQLQIAQQAIKRFSLVRAILQLYIEILPKTGEVMGTLALRTHLEIISGIVNDEIHILRAAFKCIHLQQGFGQRVGAKKTQGLIDLIDGLEDPGKKLLIWQKHKPQRDRILDALEFRLKQCSQQIQALPDLIDHMAIEKMIEQTDRRYQLAQIALIQGFSSQITPEQKQRLESATGVMGMWMRESKAAISSQAAAHPVAVRTTGNTVPLSRSRSHITSARPVRPAHSHVAVVPARPAAMVAVLSPTAQFMAFMDREAQSLWDKDPALLQQAVSAEALDRFYDALTTFQSRAPDVEVARFFSQHTDPMSFMPIPQREKHRFSWWYKSRIQHSELFYRVVCLSRLQKLRLMVVPSANAQQNNVQENIEHWRKIIQGEHQYTSQCHNTLWGWLDRFRGNIKNQYHSWQQTLSGHYSQSITVYQQHLAEHKQEIVQPAPILPKEKVEEVKQSQPGVTETVLAPMPRAASATVLSESLQPEQIWEMDQTGLDKFRNRLQQSSLLQAKASLACFLTLMLERIHQKSLSVTGPSDASQRCALLIDMFWNFFMVTEEVLIRSALTSLHDAFQTSKMGNRFFQHLGKQLLEQCHTASPTSFQEHKSTLAQ